MMRTGIFESFDKRILEVLEKQQPGGQFLEAETAAKTIFRLAQGHLENGKNYFIP